MTADRTAARGGRRDRLRRTVRGVAAAIAGTMLLSACGGDFSVYSLPLPGGADVGEEPYTVEVQFRDVLDLVPQSSVKVDDVSVGKVKDIELDDWTATVTLELNGDVKLPDNAYAEIRQTSLLGEKFVSLAPPASGSSTGLLGEGDEIPLSRSGRNPEVEEVLGAMSLLLNGGGIGQLQTINREIGNALEGREPEIRDLLTQLVDFTGQLDANKQEILRALRQLSTFSRAVLEQKDNIYEALDVMPAALRSLDSQRDELVTMLQSLQRLSGVGTRVIRATKADTVEVLANLEPILRKLADAGDAFPQSLQIGLTYPFINATVGETPVAARNIHIGDYTNLSVQLDLSLDVLLEEIPLCREDPTLPICDPPDIPTDVELPPELCKALRDAGVNVPKKCRLSDVTDEGFKTVKEACKTLGLGRKCDVTKPVDPIEDELCRITGVCPDGDEGNRDGNAGDDPLAGLGGILRGGNGDGGNTGNGGGGADDVCRVTGLCRPTPGGSTPPLSSADLARTLTSDEVDPDVAEMFLVGVVAQ